MDSERLVRVPSTRLAIQRPALVDAYVREHPEYLDALDRGAGLYEMQQLLKRLRRGISKAFRTEARELQQASLTVHDVRLRKEALSQPSAIFK